MPTVTLDNAITLHYRERGSGQKCIVLIHGFPLDGRIFDRVLAPPPTGCRVIVPDLAGFGESKFAGSFTIESLADDLHELLRKIDALPCVLGGLSMGGYVALAYAKKYPTDLAGLMLLNTRAEADSAEGKEKRNKMIALVRDRGPQAAHAVADQMLPNMIAKQHASNSQRVDSLRQIMESCSAKTIENACIAMRDREDQTAFLPSIAIPTLIVTGADDAIIPKSAGEAMVRSIADAMLVDIAECGHVSSMEKPDELTAAIIERLALR